MADLVAAGVSRPLCVLVLRCATAWSLSTAGAAGVVMLLGLSILHLRCR
jgi:hypothetical protein